MSAPGRRTYWHLEGLGRKPTDYEVATSRLLYYPGRGFEIDAPLVAWYERYQKGSAFKCRDAETFLDPRATTYTSYTEIQNAKETFIDGLLSSADGPRADQELSPAWVAVLGRVVAPLRYPAHGLQMIAAYLGHMAPNGRIVVASLFQTADEMRRVQRLAYRMRQLQYAHPRFGEDSKALWERDPVWQPLRETIERLLVTYDWGEAFVALQLAVKPAFDDLLMVHFAHLARANGDDLLARMLQSFDEDCRWHRQWSAAFVRRAIADEPGNRPVVEAWLERWRPLARRAVQAFAPVWEARRGDGKGCEWNEIGSRVDAACHEHVMAATGQTT